MGEPFIASVHYGDMKGTVAIDGHEGGPLQKLAKLTNIKPGYWPVGFQLRRFDANEKGEISFSLVAVKCEECGNSVDEFRAYNEKHGELPVYQFDGVLNISDYPALFKRIDVKVLSRIVDGLNVVWDS